MLVDKINEAFKLQKTDKIANAVLDTETGNMMEHRHLIKHKDPAVQKYGPTQRPTNSDDYSKVWEKEMKMGNG